MDNSLKNEYDTVLEAVKNNGSALEYANKKLRKNENTECQRTLSNDSVTNKPR